MDTVTYLSERVSQLEDALIAIDVASNPFPDGTILKEGQWQNAVAYALAFIQGVVCGVMGKQEGENDRGRTEGD